MWLSYVCFQIKLDIPLSNDIRFGRTRNSGTSLNSRPSLNSRTYRSFIEVIWVHLVTFGENCCCHNLNIKIVWYIKIFSLEWNFTRNLSKLSEFWPKKLKKLFKGSLAKKSDIFFFQKNQKDVKNMKLIKKVRKLFLNTCICMYLDGFGIFSKIFVHYNFLTFVQNYFGSKNTFLAIFQKYRF